MEEIEIAIVGGGICGLATALALHRKGIRSVVLERCDSQRATGAGIGILTNGWRALDQLGVASKLRQSAIPLHGVRDVWLRSGKQQTTPLSIGEARCLKRSELISTIAENLPRGTVRFGCRILSVKLDPLTSYPIIQLQDGNFIKAKAVIGCDGAHSVVADFLDLKPTKLSSIWAVRGFTDYPNGHDFPNEFVRLRGDRILMGRVPVNDKLLFWFIALLFSPKDSVILKDPELIRKLALESIKIFPTELTAMVENSDPESLSLTRLRYRSPCDVLLGRFWKGSVTVAGDAMHVMGPFLGQGGSAGVEDAIVLARCLAQKMHEMDSNASGRELKLQKFGEAFDQYIKERRLRLVKLSTQTYLMGSLLETSSLLAKFSSIVLMTLLFSNPTAHTRYDCGSL